MQTARSSMYQLQQMAALAGRVPGGGQAGAQEPKVDGVLDHARGAGLRPRQRDRRGVDEEQRQRMQAYDDLKADFESIAMKCALIYGDSSEYFTAKSAAYMSELLPQLEVTELAKAQHHLFLDQPLNFMTELTAQLDAWQ